VTGRRGLVPKVNDRRQFLPADYAVMLRWLTGAIISGNGSRPNDDIEKVMGRSPISFQEFARRNAHTWTLQAAK
jgi:hypothetical protein